MEEMTDKTTETAPVEAEAGDALDAALDAALAESVEDQVEDEGVAEGAVEAGEAGNEASEAEVEAPPVEAEVEAPQDWRADQRERFAKLPPEARELVLEQYKDFQGGFTRKSQELSAAARYAEQVHQIITDEHRRQLAVAGMDEIAGIKRLVALNDMAARDPAGYARWFMQQAGIRPEQLLHDQDYRDEHADPTVSRLEQELGTMKNSWLAFIQHQQHIAHQGAMSQVQQFATQTDEAGQPRHPHFDRVWQTMEALITRYPRLDLENAYQRSVQADPELYGEALKAAEQRAMAKVDADRNSAVEKAKKAGRHGVSGAPPGRGEVQPDDLDALLSKQLERAGIGRP